jgi:hypothetical protein
LSAKYEILFKVVILTFEIFTCFLSAAVRSDEIYFEAVISVIAILSFTSEQERIATHPGGILRALDLVTVLE